MTTVTYLHPGAFSRPARPEDVKGAELAVSSLGNSLRNSRRVHRPLETYWAASIHTSQNLERAWEETATKQYLLMGSDRSIGVDLLIASRVRELPSLGH